MILRLRAEVVGSEMIGELRQDLLCHNRIVRGAAGQGIQGEDSWEALGHE